MLLDIWKQAKTPLDYVVALWATGLLALALTGVLGFIFKWVTNPSMLDNTSFGIFDTLG